MKFEICGTTYKTIVATRETLYGYNETNPAEKKLVRRDDPRLTISGKGGEE